MLDWDDLRIFLAAARLGSFSAAAVRLAMDGTTVARRLTRLEAAIHGTLFVRSPQGLLLTPAGHRLLESSTDVERAIEAASGARSDIGTVRISASEGFGTEILAPELAALARRRPGLFIELVASSGFLSAATRQADIAVTLSPAASERISVKRLTDYTLGLYASRSYLRACGTPDSVTGLHGQPLVGYIDDLIYAPQLRYLDQISPGLKPTITSSSIRAQAEMIASGAGLGVLPCFLADQNPQLLRVLPDTVSLSRTFWVSVHSDFATSPRLRIVTDWLEGVIARRQQDLAGISAQPALDSATSASRRTSAATRVGR